MVVKNGDETYARKKIEVTLNKPKESLRLPPTPMTLSIDKMAIGGAGPLRFQWCFKNPSWRLLRSILSHQKWRKYEQLRLVVYPVFYRGFITSQVVIAGFLNHQLYFWYLLQVGREY